MNNWLKLSEAIKMMVLKGCTDENILKRRAWQKAREIFENQINSIFEKEGIKAVRELEKEIISYINWWIMVTKEEVRKGGEPYQNINLEVVKERLEGLYGVGKR